MASLTLNGGVREIGGNKILLKDGDTSVFLDFGVSLTAKKQYSSTPFRAPRSEFNLIEFGLLPRIDRLYID